MNTPKGRSKNLVIQEVEKEVLIYDLERNEAFCLNETSALVWQLCDGNRTIGEIAEVMSAKTESRVEDGLVWLALSQLKKEQLIVDEVETPIQYQGLSRRKIIRKIGFASLLALPVVASITAPTAIHAASSCLVPIVDTTCNCIYQDGNNNNGPGGPRVVGFCGVIPLTMLGADICNDTTCRCQITNVTDPNCPVLAGTGSATTHVCAGMCVV